MSCFLSNSSLGKKLVMSVTGCFLVLFILFHMSMNIVAIISPEAYNMICALLGANWYALAGTAVLAAGVVVHFIYAVILTLENLKARGSQRYAVTVVEPGVSWASKTCSYWASSFWAVWRSTSSTSGLKCSSWRYWAATRTLSDSIRRTALR